MTLPEFKFKGWECMKVLWACERDEGCQKILKDTYGCCVFKDIFDLRKDQKTAWCCTHEKMCSTEVPRCQSRHLIWTIVALHKILFDPWKPKNRQSWRELISFPVLIVFIDILLRKDCADLRTWGNKKNKTILRMFTVVFYYCLAATGQDLRASPIARWGSD